MPPHEPKRDVRVWPVIRAYAHASLTYPKTLALTLVGVIGIQAAGIIAPLYLSQFIDVLSSTEPSDVAVRSLLAILTAFAVVAAVGWVAQRIQAVSVMRLEADVMADLEGEAFSSMMHQDYGFYTSNFTGTLTRRVTRYSRAYEQVFDSVIQNFLPTILFAAGSITVLFSNHHWLGFGLLAWVVTFITVQVILTRWRHPMRVARALEDSRVTGGLSDAISNHSAITLFASEAREESRMAALVAVWQAVTKRSWFADAWIQSVQGALSLAVQIGLLVGAVFLWQQGLVTVGDFILIQLYILGLIDRIWNLGNALRRVYDAFADASEMVDVIERQVAIKDAPGAKPLELQSGRIDLSEVSFAFENDRPVLQNFSLAIEGGEKVALVGPSGAGKSTITRLLLRLHDPRSGTIRIDGQDLRGVTQESLRRAISYVPQEPALFHRTLSENIAYGKSGATEAEIMEAAKRAHCHEFISALPMGYDTLVGERGIKLSGGERQRVAIARAILKDAPILILDEATSSLDSESEALIQAAFAELMVGKTVIAIAHRLSTIMKMDRIIVVEGGNVVLTGTHDELLSQGSNLYKKLWDIQAGGFIRADE